MVLKTCVDVVFLDETSVRVTEFRVKGRAASGEQASVSRKREKVESQTAIVAISKVHGVILCEFVEGSVNADVFMEYLIDLTAAYREISSDEAVLVLDNVAFHHTDRVEKLLEKTGFHHLFTCTWSCELNPIEYLFGWWKRNVDISANVYTTEGVRAALQAALLKVEKSQVQRTIGYVETTVHRLAGRGETLRFLHLYRQFENSYGLRVNRPSKIDDTVEDLEPDSDSEDWDFRVSSRGSGSDGDTENSSSNARCEDNCSSGSDSGDWEVYSEAVGDVLPLVKRGGRVVKAHGWRAEVKRFGWRGMKQEGRKGFMGPHGQGWVSSFANENRKTKAAANLLTSTCGMRRAFRAARARRDSGVGETGRHGNVNAGVSQTAGEGIDEKANAVVVRTQESGSSDAKLLSVVNVVQGGSVEKENDMVEDGVIDIDSEWSACGENPEADSQTQGSDDLLLQEEHNPVEMEDGCYGRSDTGQGGKEGGRVDLPVDFMTEVMCVLTAAASVKGATSTDSFTNGGNPGSGKCAGESEERKKQESGYGTSKPLPRAPVRMNRKRTKRKSKKSGGSKGGNPYKRKKVEGGSSEERENERDIDHDFDDLPGVKPQPGFKKLIEDANYKLGSASGVGMNCLFNTFSQLLLGVGNETLAAALRAVCVQWEKMNVDFVQNFFTDGSVGDQGPDLHVSREAREKAQRQRALTHIRHMGKDGQMGTDCEVQVLIRLIARPTFLFQDTDLSGNQAHNTDSMQPDMSDAIALTYVNTNHFVPLWSTAHIPILGLGRAAKIEITGNTVKLL